MSRPGFYFCICPDVGMLKEYIEQLARTHTHNESKSIAWERFVYWGDEDLPALFWEHLTLQGLLNTSRLIIVRNAQNISAAVWKKLSAALGKPNPQAWLLLCLEGTWEKKQPKIPLHIAKLQCLAFADKQGWVWRHMGLDATTVRTYIQKKATTAQLHFEKNALDAFCAAVPPDATTIDNEIEKLRLMAVNGSVSVDMVTVDAYLPESNIFSFINFIQAGNMTAAWREIYRAKNDSDGMLFPFLALLMREARLLWQIKAGERVYLHPASARTKEHYAQSLGFMGISKIIEAIVQAEWHIKSGERSTEQALEAVVADLVLLFKDLPSV